MSQRSILGLPFLGLSVLFVAVQPDAAAEPKPAPVDFNREVRPILAGRCFLCHGPDDKARKAGLRLDLRETATKELKSGNRAIVPGDPAKSELIARVSSQDDDAMPSTASRFRSSSGCTISARPS